MDLMTDAELVARSQRGDLQAFNRLVQKWDAGLYRFVRRVMGNAEDAQDIVQESLLKAYVNIRHLRDPERFRSWLHHIALNLCRDWYRAARTRGATTVYEEQDLEHVRADARPAVPPADQRVERASLADLLHRVLERLPLEQRTAILLREYHGFTSDEIGQITGVPATTVRTRIFYGLRAVRRTLEQQGIVAADLTEGERGT